MSIDYADGSVQTLTTSVPAFDLEHTYVDDGTFTSPLSTIKAVGASGQNYSRSWVGRYGHRLKYRIEWAGYWGVVPVVEINARFERMNG